MKFTGKCSAGKPHAAFDEAGDGNVLWQALHGHEAGNGGHGQGNAYGDAPFLDPTGGEYGETCLLR